MIRFTWQVIPRRVAAGQFTHTCAEGQPEEQPAGQPEADRVMITARGVTAQQTQRSYENSQKPSLQQQHVPMRALEPITNYSLPWEYDNKSSMFMCQKRNETKKLFFY